MIDDDRVGAVADDDGRDPEPQVALVMSSNMLSSIVMWLVRWLGAGVVDAEDVHAAGGVAHEVVSGTSRAARPTHGAVPPWLRGVNTIA